MTALENALNPTPPSKTRNGSDGDSGVLVTTTDEQPEVFVSENGRETAPVAEAQEGGVHEGQQSSVPTPTQTTPIPTTPSPSNPSSSISETTDEGI